MSHRLCCSHRAVCSHRNKTPIETCQHYLISRCQAACFFCSKHCYFSLPISTEHSLVFIWCGDDKSIVSVPRSSSCQPHFWTRLNNFFCWQIRSATINFGNVMRRNFLFAFRMRCCESRLHRGPGLESFPSHLSSVTIFSTDRDQHFV